MNQTLEELVNQAAHDTFEKLNPETVALCRRAMAQNLSKTQVRRRVRQALVDAGAVLSTVPNTMCALDSWLAVEYAKKEKK